MRKRAALISRARIGRSGHKERTPWSVGQFGVERTLAMKACRWTVTICDIAYRRKAGVSRLADMRGPRQGKSRDEFTAQDTRGIAAKQAAAATKLMSKEKHGIAA